MSLPSIDESVARAAELQREVERVLDGASHENVICISATLMSQAIANIADSPEQAKIAVDRYSAAIIEDINRNWHLVTARRKRQ